MKYLIFTILILFPETSYSYNRIELETFVEKNIDTLIHSSANFMRNYSANTNFESCGVIAYNKFEKKYSVKVFSDQVKIGCALYKDDILYGYKLTDHIIHSHPHKKKIKIRESEINWSKQFTPHLDINENEYIDLEYNHFSSLDMHYSGNSWLVTKDNIFLKNLENKIIKIKMDNI